VSNESEGEALRRQKIQNGVPFEGARVFEPKRPADYKWISVIGFGTRKLGGVGDSQEEAVIAMLENVLVSVENMLTGAVRYKLVPHAAAQRVRALTAGFITELRALHRTVLSEQQLNDVWSLEDLDAPAKPAATDRAATLTIDPADTDDDANFL
jgi:hypothetical protein